MPHPTEATRPTDAAKILPGAVITEHPDHPHQPGEWIVAQARRVSEDPLVGDRRLIRLDYVCPDGTGVFILDADKKVTATTANPDWFFALSPADQRFVITYVTGYAPEALAHAIANAHETPDYVAAVRAQRETAATS